MRIISGKKKGMKLFSVQGENTRPTADRMKENVFNIIQDKVLNSVFLDLFAGTGAIGIEALSRGAKRAVFCDSSVISIEVIKKNLENAGFGKDGTIYFQDYKDAISRLGNEKLKFDLIFLDPPYAGDFSNIALFEIEKAEILSENGLIICEISGADCFTFESEKFIITKRKDYNKTSFIFLELIS